MYASAVYNVKINACHVLQSNENKAKICIFMFLYDAVFEFFEKVLKLSLNMCMLQTGYF